MAALTASQVSNAFDDGFNQKLANIKVLGEPHPVNADLSIYHLRSARPPLPQWRFNQPDAKQRGLSFTTEVRAAP